MLLYSAWPADPRGMFRGIGLRGGRTNCGACGNEEEISAKGLRKISREDVLAGQMDYVTFCGVVEETKLLEKEQRVDAAEFLHTMASSSRTPEVHGAKDQRRWHNAVVVDTREPHEVEMGPKLGLGINIPISRILRPEGVADVAKALVEGEHDAVIFVCQLGNDSQVAAKKLMEWKTQQENGQTEAGQAVKDGQERHNVFIGDIVGGYAALEKV